MSKKRKIILFLIAPIIAGVLASLVYGFFQIFDSDCASPWSKSKCVLMPVYFCLVFSVIGGYCAALLMLPFLIIMRLKIGLTKISSAVFGALFCLSWYSFSAYLEYIGLLPETIPPFAFSWKKMLVSQHVYTWTVLMFTLVAHAIILAMLIAGWVVGFSPKKDITNERS